MRNLIYKVDFVASNGRHVFLSVNEEYAFKNEDFFYFGELSKTNVFIGENNSGKSRFLRHLFKEKYLLISYEKFDEVCKKLGCLSSFDIFTQINRNKSARQPGLSNFLYESNIRYVEKFMELSTEFNLENKFYFPVIRGTKDYKTIIKNKLNLFLSSTKSIQNKDSINHYISLLDLESSGLESFDVYRSIINHEYFSDIPGNINDFILTGGGIYQEIKSMLLGDESQRKTIENFQQFLKDIFFEDYDKVQLIPNEKKRVLYVKIGEDERAIYDWGDGTQQLIIMLFYLYKNKDEKNKQFFIEEPEMYLHPGILRKFIEVINSDVFPNHQYFITTHSNIVLDTSADTNMNMSIFKFKKVKDKSKNNGKPFLIKQCNNGDVSLLNELGIRNSSIFLSNCSIWVEGITDRLYLKHFLKLYCEKNQNKKTYRENIDYTFIEYGGGNITHFNFDQENDDNNEINTKYINNKIFLIMDNDNPKKGSKKYLRKKKYEELLEDNFYELDALEIENLITIEILKEVLIEENKESKDIICEKLKKIRVISNKKLGKFIDSLFSDSKIKRYSASSGAIKDKIKFCKTVINITKDFDQLSDEAKKLTEKLYIFIQNNNETI